LDTNKDGEISQQEINDAVNILTKAKLQKSTQERDNLHSYFERYK
jgi:hypothetical protein